MADIFLSYSRKDSDFMRRTRDYLRGAGFTVWTDEGIEPGTDDWAEMVEREVRLALTVVLILSPDSKASKWVQKEVSVAQRNNTPIFPIMIKGDENTSVPFRLEGTQFADAREEPIDALQKLANSLRKKLRIDPPVSSNVTPPVAPPPAPSSPPPSVASSGVSAPVTTHTGVTRTVSRTGGADYRTLTDAIKGAPEGATILVRPGLYRESITIKKEIEIVGEGRREDITIESNNANAVWMETDFAVLRGISIRVNAPTDSGKNFFGIVVARGRLVIDDCDITSNVGCGIGVQGEQSDPQIRGSRIHDCGSAGVRIADKAQGKIEDSEITGSKLSGLAILRGARFRAHNCQLMHNSQNALLVNERAICTIEESQLIGNGFHGLEAANGTVNMRGCNIHENAEHGIYMHDNSSGLVENCDLTNNKRKSFNVEEGSDVKRYNNKE